MMRVHPVLFIHRDTGEPRLCQTDHAIRRFFDNRRPDEWMQCPATDGDMRRWRQ